MRRAVSMPSRRAGQRERIRITSGKRRKGGEKGAAEEMMCGGRKEVWGTEQGRALFGRTLSGARTSRYLCLQQCV